MTTKHPSVAAIIPVFNGARTIARAIDSVLAQRFGGDIEIVVVNDGSTDSTAEVLRAYGDRIKVVTQENRGLAAARNTGVRNSVGEYLAFLDADDEWMADKLAVQLPMLTERTGAVMVYSDAIQIDSSGSVVYDFYIPPSQRHAPMLEEMLADLWNILPSSIVVPRWAIDLTAGFCEEFRGFFGEDTYFYLLLRQHGRFVYLDQPLLRYYRAGVEEQLGKRITLLRRVEGTADGADAISRTLANYEIFIRLVREQFGSRSTRLVRLTRRANSNQLVTMALAAMTSGDRALARRCCRLAIEQNPSNLKTYARYWWATMPPRLAVPLARLMPKRLLRSLAGPPFGWIA